MPITTPKLGIKKPLGNETVIRASFNENWDIIDKQAVHESFLLEEPTYDVENNRVVCTIGPGLAELFSDNTLVIVEKTASTMYYINVPAVNTTYSLYLQADGTFAHNTTGFVPAGAVLLWKIATGATVSELTKTDWRARISGTGVKLAAHLADYAGHGADSAATANRIILRDAAGRAKVATPSAVDDIARKDNVDAVQTNLTNHQNDTTTVHGATSAATANKIIIRDAAGRAKVAAPSAIDDIARKDTVDAVQTNLNAHLADTAPHSATSAATADRIILRDAAGRAKVAAPSASDDIARKQEVDAKVSKVGDTMTGALTLPSIVVSTTALNGNSAPSTYQDGFSYFSVSNDGTWPASYGVVFTTRIGSVRCMQVFWEAGGGYGQWVRYKTDGADTWQPWQKAWHAGNDGAGSGLDADLVKGRANRWTLNGSLSAYAAVYGGITIYDDQIVWDNSSLFYMVNSNSDIIEKFNSSFVLQGSFASPNITPYDITFDGTNLWLNGGSGTDTCYKLNSSGTVLGSFAQVAGADSRGLTWDGTYLWVGDNGQTGDLMCKYNTSGTLLASWSYNRALMPILNFRSNMLVGGCNNEFIYYNTSGTILFTQQCTNLVDGACIKDTNYYVVNGANVYVYPFTDYILTSDF